jgi:hypothetical protein
LETLRIHDVGNGDLKDFTMSLMTFLGDFKDFTMLLRTFLGDFKEFTML